MWLVPYNSRRVAPRFHSLLADFFRGFDLESSQSATGRSFSPHLDIKEDENAYHILVEVPGMDKESVDVSLKDNILTIKGEKKQETQEEKEGYAWVERSYGAFQRSVRLPDNTKDDQVEACLENGVLAITLPKTEQPKRKQIAIN